MPSVFMSSALAASVKKHIRVTLHNCITFPHSLTLEWDVNTNSVSIHTASRMHSIVESMHTAIPLTQFLRSRFDAAYLINV